MGRLVFMKGREGEREEKVKEKEYEGKERREEELMEAERKRIIREVKGRKGTAEKDK